MAIARIHSRPLPLSARSSHLPTSACSTGLPSPQVRAPRCCAVHGSLGSRKPGSGDEDDRSADGFGVLNCIRRLLQLGVFKEPLLPAHFLAPFHSSICNDTEEMQCPSSSHSTHDIHLMGDEGSHCDGCSNDQIKIIVHVHQNNHSDKSSRTTSKRNKYRTRATQVGTRTNNTQDHRVDMHSSDDKTSSDENEKLMKGRWSYVHTMATSSQAGTLFLVPYLALCCSNTTLSIPQVWMEVLPIGYIFLLLTVALVASHSSQFKDGKLPDNAGFKLLQILYAVVLVCLLAGLFIPLHGCRGMSNLVVWTSAAGALLMIAISWSIAFHHKTVINCIKAPCQMVIKWTKNIYEKVQSWMPNVSLSECIKAKFKKMPEEKSYPGLPMEPV